VQLGRCRESCAGVFVQNADIQAETKRRADLYQGSEVNPRTVTEPSGQRNSTRPPNQGHCTLLKGSSKKTKKGSRKKTRQVIAVVTFAERNPAGSHGIITGCVPGGGFVPKASRKSLGRDPEKTNKSKTTEQGKSFVGGTFATCGSKDATAYGFLSNKPKGGRSKAVA